MNTSLKYLLFPIYLILPILALAEESVPAALDPCWSLSGDREIQCTDGVKVRQAIKTSDFTVFTLSSETKMVHESAAHRNLITISYIEPGTSNEYRDVVHKDGYILWGRMSKDGGTIEVPVRDLGGVWYFMLGTDATGRKLMITLKTKVLFPDILSRIGDQIRDWGKARPLAIDSPMPGPAETADSLPGEGTPPPVPASGTENSVTPASTDPGDSNDPPTNRNPIYVDGHHHEPEDNTGAGLNGSNPGSTDGTPATESSDSDRFCRVEHPEDYPDEVFFRGIIGPVRSISILKNPDGTRYIKAPGFLGIPYKAEVRITEDGKLQFLKLGATGHRVWTNLSINASQPVRF